MIRFFLNGENVTYQGDPKRTLLEHLRLDHHLTAAKDGCSGQGVCGACTVEVDGKARLACLLPMEKLKGANVLTLEGFPEYVRNVLVNSFVNKGAVQCGFCIPGIISRSKVLLQNNPNPNIEAVRNALKPHLCRCTGFKKIEEGIMAAADALRENKQVPLEHTCGCTGKPQPKYLAQETASGERLFVDDIFFDGMLFGALKFSDHPKAIIKAIHTEEACKIPGVTRVFTAADIPGKTHVGLIYDDWPVMIGIGQTTHFIGDVVAGVVAESEAIARKAVETIQVEYEVLKPVTDVFEAIEGNRVHASKPNCFNITKFTVGSPDEAFDKARYMAADRFETQRVEHAFMEKESAVARPGENDTLVLYSQSQGVYVDRKQIAPVLDIPEDKLRVVQVENGGAFGGKEDLSIQAHTALFSYLLQLPVKITLSRSESIRLHPKRHPVFMDMELAADESGKIIGLRLLAMGDTGAYASVGTKVMERVAGHAAAGYFIPNVDIEARTVYTNNVPCGAMRGFGANQVNFAIETCIDDICYQAGFDRWQFRWDNALIDGLRTSTGQKVSGTGIRACLEALKEEYKNAPFAGLAVAIKNSGVGNGMIDESKVVIEILDRGRILIKHGWTEMGQGVHTMAIQTLCQETGLSPEIMDVRTDTADEIPTGMTTSSRGTALLGLAVIDAAKALKNDLRTQTLEALAGKTYRGQFVCDWTTKPGTPGVEQITHYSYGYAAQLCVLDHDGKIKKMVAAHDAGKIMNPVLFEGQIQGGVHMGLGYALREELPMKDGFLLNDNMGKLGILRAHETPEIIVKGVEVKDPVGPYGVKGIGEIGMVPTASAIANAFYAFDGKKRTRLPLFPKNERDQSKNQQFRAKAR
ncbi:MAG TPA: selenium-dependent xanthine dehydrogenase [Bacteroidales bacterium]|nr:selenium-dependent xanthine dehydrogenase [Bacteroidales bacterium]